MIRIPSVDLEFNLLGDYLVDLENLLIVAEHKHLTERRELEAEIDQYRKEMEKAEQRIENMTDEEREYANNKAFEARENEFLFGYSDHHSDYDYYDSPDFNLEITMAELDQVDYVQFDFKYVLRSSFFVHIYFVIEVRLNKLCAYVQEMTGIPFSVKHLRHSGIRAAKDYLIKATRIQVGDLGGWQELTYYNKIRNVLVHQNRVLNPSRDDQKLKIDYVQRSDVPLGVDGQNRITFDRGFCERVLDNAREFFTALEAEVRGKSEKFKELKRQFENI